MKAKHGLMLLIIGFLLCMAGALLKIMHWPAGSALLLVGLGCEAVGGLLLVVKMLTPNKAKDFLNR